MTFDWDKFIHSVDKVNVAGDYPKAKELLQARLKKKRIPRRRAFELVHHLCNAGMAGEALSLVAPYMRTRPGIAETVEYARALIFSGTGQSAARILLKIRDSLSPRGLYTLSLAQGITWEFKEARESMEMYLSLKGLSVRDRIIARMNLGIFIRREGKDLPLAEKLLAESMLEGKRKGFDFIERDARREWAYCPLLMGNPRECIRRLDEYNKMYPDPEPDKWPIEKAWEALAYLDMSGTKETLVRMHHAKDELERLGFHHVLRTMSFHEGRIRNDKGLLLKVYFSTSFKSLKEDVKKILGPQNIPEVFDLYVGTTSKTAKPRFTIDLLNGDYGNPDSEKLKQGSVMQRMLFVLGSDPFKRFRLWHFFETIFPGETIDPLSAKRRIEQGLHRLRLWLKQEELPLEIRFEGGLIWLHAFSPCALRISGPEKSVMGEELDAFLKELKKTFKAREFNSSEVIENTGMSPRTVLRRLKSAVSSGDLQLISSGPKTRYKIYRDLSINQDS